MEHWEALHGFRTRVEIGGLSIDTVIAKHPNIEKQGKRVGCLSVEVFYREWIPFYSEFMVL